MNIKAQFGKDKYKGEESKFECLTNHEGKPCGLSCIAIKKGVAFDETRKPACKLLPQREKLIGRSKIICDIMKTLTSNRMIWIHGETGMGKSAIAKETSWLCFERNKYPDGVVYMSARGSKDFCSMVENLFYSIKEAMIKNSDRDSFEKLINSEYHHKYNKVLSSIKNLNFLLVLDNLDQIVDTEEEFLKVFIEDITSNSGGSKILFSSVSPPS